MLSRATGLILMAFDSQCYMLNMAAVIPVSTDVVERNVA